MPPRTPSFAPENINNNVPNVLNRNSKEKAIQRETTKQINNILKFPALNVSIIREKEKDPGKTEEIIRFCESLVKILPKEEASDFLKDPINFVSKTLVFRGLDHFKYEQVKERGHFRPESGEMGSLAVFLTNRPYGALSYARKGVLAVIPRQNLVLLDNNVGLTASGEERYTIESNRLHATGMSVWDVQNYIDTEDQVLHHPNEKYLSLRKPQPIEAAQVFLVWKDGKVQEEFPAQHEEKKQTG